MVRAGPDPAVDGVVRLVPRRPAAQDRGAPHVSRCMSGPWASYWQAWDFAGSRCAAEAGKRPTGAVPDPPHHPKSDAQAQEAFKKTSPPRVPTPCRKRRRASPWRSASRRSPGAAIGPRPMADARVGRQGTLTRIRAERGTRPRAPRDTRYKWALAIVLGVAGVCGRSSWRHRFELDGRPCSTGPAGMAQRHWRCLSTSLPIASALCPRTRSHRDCPGLSAPLCAPTASPSPYSRHTTRSSRNAATPRTSSRATSRPSNPSRAANTPKRSKAQAVGMNDHFGCAVSRSIGAWIRWISLGTGHLRPRGAGNRDFSQSPPHDISCLRTRNRLPRANGVKSCARFLASPR